MRRGLGVSGDVVGVPGRQGQTHPHLQDAVPHSVVFSAWCCNDPLPVPNLLEVLRAQSPVRTIWRKGMREEGYCEQEGRGGEEGTVSRREGWGGGGL